MSFLNGLLVAVKAVYFLQAFFKNYVAFNIANFYSLRNQNKYPLSITREIA